MWLRAAAFTILCPGTVAVLVPRWLIGDASTGGGWWRLGWVLLAAGALLYFLCLGRFLAAGGTGAIFFTRPVRWLLGEEPGQLVRGGLYGWSRNPMYLSVVLAIFGQAVLFASPAVAIYGAGAWLTFHAIVLLVEEPHLRRKQGAVYEEYCRQVPRWFL